MAVWNLEGINLNDRSTCRSNLGQPSRSSRHGVIGHDDPLAPQRMDCKFLSPDGFQLGHGIGFAIRTAFSDGPFTASATHGDAVDDKALLVLVA